jgi:23S rRNA pseudouridine1911/1915/1917 synthase
MKIIFEETTSQRIDKFLKNLDIEELYSRSYIDKLIDFGAIKVNDKPIRKSYKLNAGDSIEIDFPEKKDLTIEAEDIPLDIIWEDEYLVIVNKPVGLTVHPAAGNPDGTLVNALMYYLKGNISTGSDARRPGIVHRLDKDTSGLLIAAKDDKTHSLLSRMFQNREIKKTYLAVTVGAPKERTGTIDNFIERSKTDRKKMAVSKTGKRAITHFRVLTEYDFFAVIEVDLETGRTHQIRVHFSNLNCPVLGDETYSNLKRTLNTTPHQFHKKIKFLLAKHLKRQALHAYKLSFTHPITEGKIEVEAPIPEDIQYTLAWLQKNFEV